jgi:hypothetical protein
MKTLLILFLSCACLVGQREFLPRVNLALVGLGWTASPDAEVIGYRIYSGPASGHYTAGVDVGNVTEWRAVKPQGATWYAVTAYDAGGAESIYSNEVSIP